MTKRTEKVNMLIKEVVSGILFRAIQFPEGMLVTVTRVVTSPDIHYANVFLTVFSREAQDSSEVMKILQKNIGAIQRQLNKALNMRPVPRIQFLIDEEEMRREKVELLLRGDRESGQVS